jgi:hypothetical protein
MRTPAPAGVRVCALRQDPGMNRKRPPMRHVADKRAERERQAGLDPDDEAARWLSQHDPKPPPKPSKSAFKSKALHRWRQRRDSP